MVWYILWNPVKHVHKRFNDPFKDLVLLMLLSNRVPTAPSLGCRRTASLHFEYDALRLG